MYMCIYRYIRVYGLDFMVHLVLTEGLLGSLDFDNLDECWVTPLSSQPQTDSVAQRRACVALYPLRDRFQE